MDERQIEALRVARAARSDAARPDVVSTLRLGGRLSARERMRLLQDADSAVDYGIIAAAEFEQSSKGAPASGNAPTGGATVPSSVVAPESAATAAPVAETRRWIAETGGVDAFCTIDGQPAIVSSTDYTDSGGGYGAARLGRLFALAIAQRWPLVMFVDGGGSRARHPRSGRGHVELSGAIGPFTLFDGMAELSGRVPTIAIVSGPSFAGHASLAGFSDIVIATRGSSIGMGGPPMVEAALGKKLTPQQLAGAEMQADNGGIELLVDDEPAAIAAARRCLAYWRDAPGNAAPPAAVDIAALVPDVGQYDVHAVIDALVDANSFTELRGRHAGAVVVGMARIGGRSIGIMASNPFIDEGCIDELAAQKISRHIELCDAWALPMLVLVDTGGTLTRWVARDGSVTREPGHSRQHLRALVAHQRRTVPLLSVQLRRGRGLAPVLMTGYSTGASVSPLAVAWPGVELNRADGFAMVRDANAFDDIVEPAATRTMLLRLLPHLRRDRERRPATERDGEPRPRPVDSW